MPDHTIHLLCESCGYQLDETREEPACPECGRPVAESLPSVRTGSPWQNRRSIRAWFSTILLVFFSPRKLFSTLRIEMRGVRELLMANLVIAGFLITDPWTGVLVGDPARTVRGKGVVIENLVHAISLFGAVLLVAGVLLLLTWIECLGVRFIAARRGWRVTRAAAWQICAHASVGWILCGLIPVLSLAGVFIAARFFGASPGGVIDLTGWLTNPPTGGPNPGPRGLTVNLYQLVVGGGVLVGYAGGLLVFETLVYLGIRACRYANPPEALAAQAAAP